MTGVRAADDYNRDTGRFARLLYAAILASAGFAVYAGSLSVPFVFDDVSNILQNPSLRSFNPWWGPLLPPRDLALATRPVVSLSLAMNWAFGGSSVFGYHLVNILIHILAGLFLFGLVRRTLESPKLSSSFGKRASGLAFAVALLWLVHPLQTESVTYVIQRCESLMGLFFFMILYFYARGLFSETHSHLWKVAVGASFILGILTKEVMAMAPLVALCYDRVFVSRSFRRALERSYGLYVAFFAGIVLFAALMVSRRTGVDAASMDAGRLALGHPVHNSLAYFFTQSQVIIHYLKMTVLPHPLVFHHAWPMAGFFKALPYLSVLAALFLASLAGVARGRAWSFLGVWFFLILAPSSSFHALNQVAAEHRMYLALAAPLSLLVLLGYRFFCRVWKDEDRAARAGFALVLVLAGALAFGTMERNKDYRTPLALWEDSVAKAPDSPQARAALGNLYLEMGNYPGAVEQYEAAVAIRPDFGYAQAGLGEALLRAGRTEEALSTLQKAVELHPELPLAWNNLAHAHLANGETDAAVRCAFRAVELRPGWAEARVNLGAALARKGEGGAALEQFDEALRIDPALGLAQANAALMLLNLGRPGEAAARALKAAKLSPKDPEVLAVVGKILLQTGSPDQAALVLENAAAARGPDVRLWHLLAVARIRSDDLPGAEAALEKVLALDPENAPAHADLGVVLARLGRMNMAASELERAVKINPDYVEGRLNLGRLLVIQGDREGARREFEKVLETEPGNLAAKQALEALKAGTSQ